MWTDLFRIRAADVWVLDRGLVSEANLAWLRQRGATYLVDTPKSQLKAYQAALLERTDWHERDRVWKSNSSPRPKGPNSLFFAAAESGRPRYGRCWSGSWNG